MRKPGDQYDVAFGCLLGACVGDAAGATLEFLGRVPSLADVNDAMRMPGGGVWDIAPGQITDDGELTLCLAQALAESPIFQREIIAEHYRSWLGSEPFDRGATILRAFSAVGRPGWKTAYETESMAEAMAQAASEHSMGSKANGSLMRATPLGLWGYLLNDDTLASYAWQDSSLSHPNESCCDAVACYVIAIASLMRDWGQHETAFVRAQRWASRHANREVQEWLDVAYRNVNEPYYPQTGFVRIAFIHAFRHLALGTPYADAVQETLLGGGDTDTNACIVGGLIGAACGAHAIPDEMKTPVVSCDTHSGTHPRPEFLRTTHLEKLTQRLLDVGAMLSEQDT